MIRRPPRSTLFPTRRSSDLPLAEVATVYDELTTSGAVIGQLRGFAFDARQQEPASGYCTAQTNTLGCRSEEHTSELQSQSNLVCRLLLEKKKKNKQPHC